MELRYGHQLTPLEQQQPPTQIVPAEQIQALAAPNPERVGDIEQSILKGAYEAAHRRAEALQEQRGIQNDLARTALGQVFTGAGNISGENRIAEGRLRGVAASGEPIFEKVGAQAERERARQVRQAAVAPPAEPVAFGPQPQAYQQPVQFPAPDRSAAQPVSVSEQFDPYHDEMVEAHRAQRRENQAAQQRQDSTGAASRLERQPADHVDEDSVFDDPLGNSRRRYTN